MGKQSQEQKVYAKILHDNFEEVEKLYKKSKLSASQIAQHFKIDSRCAVIGFCSRHFGPRGQGRPPSVKLSEQDKKAILRRYTIEYASFEVIAEIFNISVFRVKKIIADAGIPVRKNTKKQSRINRILHMKMMRQKKQDKANAEKKKGLTTKDSLPQSGMCKFPVGDSVPFKWCDKKATKGSYCDECHEKCHSKEKYNPFIGKQRFNLGNKFIDR